MEGKTACFIGHRDVLINDKEKNILLSIIKNLIEKEGVYTYIFGSKSMFDNVCHEIISLLQNQYENIKRVVYTCKNEYAVKCKEVSKIEKLLKSIAKSNKRIKAYEEERNYKNKYKTRKESYIKRNEAMIEESDICIFYYKKEYKPAFSNSGTALAYTYATKKGKTIINVCEFF